jgi:hypothetical protein
MLGRGASPRSFLTLSGGVPQPVLAFVTAHNFAKNLKALKRRTPYQVVCEA